MDAGPGPRSGGPEVRGAVHGAGIWYLLRLRGWSAQMGARRAIERDDGAIEVWKTQTWGQIKDGGGSRRVDRLRGRVRPVAEAAAVQDLGAARDTPVIRVRGAAAGTSRSPGWPATGPATEPADLAAAHLPGAKGETKAFTWSEYRDLLIAAHRQGLPRSSSWSGITSTSICTRSPRLHQRPGVAARVPAALRPGP